MSNQQAAGDPVPQAPPATTNAGATRPTGESSHVIQTPANQPPSQVEFGQSLPGQPPAGFPNGGDVDMYGNTRPVASEDPTLRTGDINENPPGDPPTPDQLAQMRRFLEEHGG